jgi:hypothetical protein
MSINIMSLERMIDRITSKIEINEDFGLRCLHMQDLNEKLSDFHKKYNQENKPEIHKEIFEHTISYLEKWGWSEASLEGEAGYLVSR